MSWPKSALGPVCVKIGSGVTPRGGDAVYLSEGVSLIRSQNVYNSRFDFDGLAHISDEQADAMSGVEVTAYDVLLNITGDSVARCCRAPKDTLPARVNQHVSIIRPDPSVLDADFLCYFLTSPFMQSTMLSLAGSGGTRKALTKAMIENFAIPLPQLNEQKRISMTLRAYDDHISNNQRRIELLEKSARLLFKEWFVRLRYPGHEHEKVVRGVPKGWTLSTVGAVSRDFIDGDWLESKDQGGDLFRILQISNIGDNSFIETGNFRYISDETFRRLNCTEVVPGDILISRMPDPIGRAWLVTQQPWRIVTAVDVTIARPDTEQVEPIYFLHHLNSSIHLARCAARASGTTRPRIAKRVMGALPIVVPPMRLQEEFSDFAVANNQLRERLARQSETLIRARDLLLPRLMDGRIAV